MADSNDDLVAGGQVAQAGIDAAAAEPTAAAAKPASRRAIRAKAKETNVNLSDEDVDRLSDAIVDKIEDRGGFEEPPEPVTAPGAAGAAPPGAPVPEPVPVKRTWAERHFSSGRH